MKVNEQERRILRQLIRKAVVDFPIYVGVDDGFESEDYDVLKKLANKLKPIPFECVNRIDKK